MATRENPTTCQEAASRFREWARNSAHNEIFRVHTARAEILDAFGNAPVPEALLRTWDFER